MNTLDKIRALDPVTDEDLQAATRNRDEVRSSVLSRAEATEAGRPSAGGPSSVRQGWNRSRRWVPVLVAASLVGGIALTMVERSGNSQPEALAFAYQGDDLKITVVDLQADTKRFNRELEQQGLKFKLVLVPATPSLVGQETAAGFSDGSNARHVTVGETPAGCMLGVDTSCHIEISVAKDFRGEGVLEIGRPLRPDEAPLAAASLNAVGEPLAGAKWGVLRVGEAKEMLGKRGLHVSEYSAEFDERNYSEVRESVPDTWYVRDGVQVGAKDVKLTVSEKP
ncbi:hypothetical protein [Kribbella endophytica]